MGWRYDGSRLEASSAGNPSLFFFVSFQAKRVVCLLLTSILVAQSLNSSPSLLLAHNHHHDDHHRHARHPTTGVHGLPNTCHIVPQKEQLLFANYHDRPAIDNKTFAHTRATSSDRRRSPIVGHHSKRRINNSGGSGGGGASSSRIDIIH